MKRLAFIFDAPGHITPAWFSAAGPNGGMRFFLRRLVDVAEKFDPTYLAVAFDSKPYFRCEIDPAYKADRAEKDPDLERQIANCQDALALTGVEVLRTPTYEADDLIASYCAKYKESLDGIAIFSPDKDCHQLLQSGKVTIAKRVSVQGIGLEREIVVKWYSTDDLWNEYGVTPAQWVDFQCLCGDVADNIQGARGIGPAHAKRILRIWGTLDKALENVESLGLGGKLASSLRDFAPLRERVNKLVSLATDVPLANSSVLSEERFLAAYERHGLDSRCDPRVLLKYRCH